MNEDTDIVFHKTGLHLYEFSDGLKTYLTTRKNALSPLKNRSYGVEVTKEVWKEEDIEVLCTKAEMLKHSGGALWAYGEWQKRKVGEG